jgi:ectoine hydroxylase-related dioxygenase (phytanoyl-CoA dioxygenase family)
VALLDFHRDGAQLFKRAATDCLDELLAALAELPTDCAGIRLAGIAGLAPLLATDGPIGSIATSIQGHATRPVRAILFDKTPDMNWSLGWHQDRTICVKERIDMEGFGPWTIKQGMQHVAPPFELLARMVTLRVHLDDVPADNAPLMIAPASHRKGLVSEPVVQQVVQECGTYACLANRGDIWIYATPILHASEASASAGRRKVLQVDYSADELPGGLEWLGI